MRDETSAKPRRSSLLRNWVSLSGAVLSAGSLFAFVLLLVIAVFAPHGNPYIGILAYVVSPIFFFLGLALFLIGVWWQRIYRARHGGGARPSVFTIDLSRPRDRKVLVVFILGTVGFLLLTATDSYETY